MQHRSPPRAPNQATTCLQDVRPPPHEHDPRVFEANSLPLWLYDLETQRVLDANPAACAKYGYTREEFLALSLADIDVPSADRRLAPDVRTHRVKGGSHMYVEVSALDVTCNSRRARCICPQDVTPLARTVAALRQSEAALRHAQVVAALAHVITRPDGSFESWSETLANITGSGQGDTPKSIRGWLRRIVHPDDRARLRAAILLAQATGQRTNLQYRILRVDGAVAYIRHVIELIEGDGGLHGLPRWFSTLQDVTRQTLSELHVRQLNQNLEQRVCERTAAAESANRAKSDFLSSLSHELRTPLNAILGFGELLAASDPAMVPHHKRALFAEQIVKAGQHVLTLVNETLDLARIEAGKLSLHIERVVLAEVLDECVAMIEPLAARRRIRLAFPARCDAQVAADRTRLRQIILNLLSNAVKYDRDGGTVRLECDDRGEHVHLAVHDTGPGMKADDVNALFQPFSRPGQDGRGSEGTGIGLVITRRLLEAMGGHIGVLSSPGEGTTFWIEVRSANLCSPSSPIPVPQRV